MPGPARSAPSLCKSLIRCILAVSATACGGCWGGNSGPVDAEGWRLIGCGPTLRGWFVAQGRVHPTSRGVTLDGRTGRSSIVATDVWLEDGDLEVEILRHDVEDNDGPYTIGLRLPLRWTWSSVYFVCRRDNVEVCKATHDNATPSPEHRVRFAPIEQEERWRFVLSGSNMECWLSGRKLMTYEDLEPRGGSLTITADRCVIDVRRVRYRLAASREE